jgi:hypothetical protein
MVLVESRFMAPNRMGNNMPDIHGDASGRSITSGTRRFAGTSPAVSWRCWPSERWSRDWRPEGNVGVGGNPARPGQSARGGGGVAGQTLFDLRKTHARCHLRERTPAGASQFLAAVGAVRATLVAVCGSTPFVAGATKGVGRTGDDRGGLRTRGSGRPRVRVESRAQPEPPA